MIAEAVRVATVVQAHLAIAARASPPCITHTGICNAFPVAAAVMSTTTTSGRVHAIFSTQTLLAHTLGILKIFDCRIVSMCNNSTFTAVLATTLVGA